MSSIRRARSSARPSAADGVLAISGEPSAPRTSGVFAHLRISSASSSRRSSGGDRLRQRERGFGQLAGGGFGEGDLVFVEIAERDDARQDGGVGFEFVEEHLARQPAGAPGRQIERGAGELKRIARGRKAGDEFARAQGVDQHRQKRRRGGDVEDVGRSWVAAGIAESYTLWRGATPCWRGSPVPPRRWRRGCRHASTGLPAATRAGGRLPPRGRTDR